MPQTPCHPVPLYCATYRLRDDEPDARGCIRRVILPAGMHDDIRLRRSNPPLDGVAELRRPCHPVLSREHCELSGGQAVSERRPLRRRPDTMARPARVRIRSRKPCTLARRRLFGWKVRLPLATAALSCQIWQTRPMRPWPTEHRDCRY